MQFTTLFLSLLVGSVAAQSVCYDNFDCILSGGGACVKPAGKILGYVLFSRAAVGHSRTLSNMYCSTCGAKTTAKTTTTAKATTTAKVTTTAKGSAIGSFSQAPAPTTAKPTTIKTTTSVAAPSATGSVCFDDGDCLLKGGKCVKSGLLG
jgi:hypothetical protein